MEIFYLGIECILKDDFFPPLIKKLKILVYRKNWDIEKYKEDGKTSPRNPIAHC